MLLAKREILLDSRHIRLVDDAHLSELALLFGTLGREQMAPPGMPIEHLARARYFEALGYGFLRLAACYRFWHGRETVSRFPEMAMAFFFLYLEGFGVHSEDGK